MSVPVNLSQQEIIDRLKGMPAFAKWSPIDIQDLAGRMMARAYAGQERIFDPSGQADNAYVVHDGQVRQLLEDGSRDWTYRTLSQGGLFSQQALFHGRSFASTAIAENSGCVLLEIEAADLAWALSRYPDLWKQLLHPEVATRLRAIPLLRSLSDSQIERLADSTTSQDFKPGQVICSTNDADGFLWIIDHGQAEVTGQAHMTLAGGNLGTVASRMPRLPLLTAGNWFVGGLVKLPNQLTVSAKARTPLKLLRIPGPVLVSMAGHFPDVESQLGGFLDLTQTLENHLATNSMFRDLREAQWQDLAGYAGRQHIPAGIAVSRQGDQGSNLFLLVEGGAVIRASDEEGRERPRHFLSPGSHYGINSLLSSTRRDATVAAVPGATQTGDPLDGSDWLSLNRDDLRYMVRLRPELWRGTMLYRRLLEEPRKRRFDWLEAEETIEYVGRRHIIALIERILLVVILAVAIAVIAFLVVQQPLSPALAATAFLLLALIFPFIDYYDDYYAVTNLRVTRHNRTLFIYENRVEAPLERIQDVTLTTTLLARIIGYGDLKIRTAAKTGTVLFRQVPDPERVQAIVFQGRRRAQAGRRAERREAMRSQLIKNLELRMTANRPDRVLPAGIKLPPRGAWQRFWHSLARLRRGLLTWLQELPRKLLSILLWPLPKRLRKRAMPPKKKPKKDKEVEEIVYRKHWLFLLRKILLPVLLFAGLILLIAWVELGTIHDLLEKAGVPNSWVLLVSLLPLMASFLAIIYRTEDWRNDRYILGQTHIIDVEALPFGLREQKRQAEWNKVQNATYTLPSFWANLFDFGTVIIETASSEGKFDFVNVPQPRLVQQEVFRRLEAARLAQETKEALERHALFSEALELYDDLVQSGSWPTRRPPTSSP